MGFSLRENPLGIQAKKEKKNQVIFKDNKTTLA